MCIKVKSGVSTIEPCSNVISERTSPCRLRRKENISSSEFFRLSWCPSVQDDAAVPSSGQPPPLCVPETQSALEADVAAVTALHRELRMPLEVNRQTLARTCFYRNLPRVVDLRLYLRLDRLALRIACAEWWLMPAHSWHREQYYSSSLRGFESKQITASIGLAASEI